MTSTSAASDETRTAKLFLYLDEQRMHSVSSQLFEGFTDYAVHHSINSRSEREKQDGPMMSGRTLSDMHTEGSVKEERRFLLDWAYTSFEQRLVKTGSVHCLDGDGEMAVPESGFVRVTGCGGIRDVGAAISFIRQFNELGEALTYITAHEALELSRKTALAEVSTTNRNKLAAAKAAIESRFNIKELAKSQGLNFDPKFLSSLVSVLNQWFSDHVEAIVHLDEREFIAILNPEHLREQQLLLARKYGRGESVPLTVFGTIIPKSIFDKKKEAPASAATDQSLRDAVRTMLGVFAEMENTLLAPAISEVSIDPIAVYTEVPVLGGTPK